MWQLQRPKKEDARIVELSPTLTAALRCNTAVYLMCTAEQAKAAHFYIVKYVTKNPVDD